MNHEEAILERLDQIERQLKPLADSAASLRELRDDLTPRVNEAVKALIVELADVESDFQLEDLLFLTKKLMRNVRTLAYALEQLRNLVDFALTAEPLLKTTVPHFISYLDELEQKGVFRLLNSGMAILQRISETYSVEEVEQIGDGMVRMLGMLKNLTTPEALDLLERGSQLPNRIDLSRAKPAGPFRMLWTLGNKDVKEGLGVLLELTKGLAVMKG